MYVLGEYAPADMFIGPATWYALLELAGLRMYEALEVPSSVYEYCAPPILLIWYGQYAVLMLGC